MKRNIHVLYRKRVWWQIWRGGGGSHRKEITKKNEMSEKQKRNEVLYVTEGIGGGEADRGRDEL